MEAREAASGREVPEDVCVCVSSARPQPGFEIFTAYTVDGNERLKFYHDA